jgi:hypothetical protein
MAYNDRKILQVLRGELGKVNERCAGYRVELRHLLGDVLIFEREHTISKTNVVQKIADQVNTVGMFLYKSYVESASSKGG